MITRIDAFNKKKHDETKDMQHKSLSIYISQDQIFDEKPNYGKNDYRKFVSDQFMKEHSVEVLNFEKLVFYATVSDTIMRITGHIGYSLSDRRE